MDLDEEDALWKRLREFGPSSEIHPHPSGQLACTDGVRYLVEHYDLGSIVDVIAASQPRARTDPDLREFQLWELRRCGKQRFAVCSRTVDDEAFRLDVSRSATRLPYLRLYAQSGILMLPSEHS